MVTRALEATSCPGCHWAFDTLAISTSWSGGRRRVTVLDLRFCVNEGLGAAVQVAAGFHSSFFRIMHTSSTVAAIHLLTRDYFCDVLTDRTHVRSCTSAGNADRAR